jgi:hypothetical protein
VGTLLLLALAARRGAHVDGGGTSGADAESADLVGIVTVNLMNHSKVRDVQLDFALKAPEQQQKQSQPSAGTT